MMSYKSQIRRAEFSRFKACVKRKTIKEMTGLNPKQKSTLTREISQIKYSREQKQFARW